MRPLLFASLACLALAACKTEITASTDPLTLMGGEGVWQVTRINGQPIAAGVEVTMGMMKEGLIGGTSGCNRYSGRIAMVDGVLHMGKLAGTRMMCPAPQMSAEAAFYAAMAEARSMEREGGALVVRSKTGAELIRATR